MDKISLKVSFVLLYQHYLKANLIKSYSLTIGILSLESFSLLTKAQFLPLYPILLSIFCTSIINQLLMDLSFINACKIHILCVARSLKLNNLRYLNPLTAKLSLKAFIMILYQMGCIDTLLISIIISIINIYDLSLLFVKHESPCENKSQYCVLMTLFSFSIMHGNLSLLTLLPDVTSAYIDAHLLPNAYSAYIDAHLLPNGIFINLPSKSTHDYG